MFDTPGLCAYITRASRRTTPAQLVNDTEALYKALALMPQDASLRDLYLELLTSQVAGLYDDETKKMYVGPSTGGIGPAEEITYAHEYTHALQDQEFTLRDLMGDATDQSDRTLARSTLVEGDATLLMTLWAQQHMTPPGAGRGRDGASIRPREAILARMPAILKDAAPVPVHERPQHDARRVQQAGGFGGVDGLFANPPDSTEQVMHPEKLAAREPPVPVAFPDDFAGSLGEGWTIALQDTLGEFLLGGALRTRPIRRREHRRDRLGRRPRGAGRGPGRRRRRRARHALGHRRRRGRVRGRARRLRREARGARAAPPSILRPAPDRVVLVSAERRGHDGQGRQRPRAWRG